MWEDLFNEEWREGLGQIVEAVAKRNIDRIRQLEPNGNAISFQVQLDKGSVKIGFYSDDIPIPTDHGLEYGVHLHVGCRDQHGLWDNMIDSDGNLLHRMHFMGVVPDAANDFGECEVITAETLSEWLGE